MPVLLSILWSLLKLKLRQLHVDLKRADAENVSADVQPVNRLDQVVRFWVAQDTQCLNHLVQFLDLFWICDSISMDDHSREEETSGHYALFILPLLEQIEQILSRKDERAVMGEKQKF